MPAIRKRSLTIAGHRTSISLEDAFWAALKDVAAEQGRTAAELVAEIDSTRAGKPACRARSALICLSISDGASLDGGPAKSIVPQFEG